MLEIALVSRLAVKSILRLTASMASKIKVNRENIDMATYETASTERALLGLASFMLLVLVLFGARPFLATN